MTTQPSPISTRLILGVGITLIGVALLLDRLGLIDAERYVEFWPIILVAIGLGILARAGQTGRWLGGAVVTLLGLILLGRQLDLIPFGIDELWPLFIILAGLGILRRGIGRGDGGSREHLDDRISQFGFLCGLNPRVRSQSFQGGEVNAFMGGVELDLTGADVGEEEAVLVTFAMMGGIVIIVPRDWTVTAQVTPLMGGIEDNTDGSDSDPAKRLTVRGFVMMGGIEVRN